MFSPRRALYRAHDGSEPLPEVPALEALYRQGFRPRRGEFVMIAGQPGAGKSAFAMWWIASMNLPCLYFAADMTAHQVSTRLAAVLTGHTVDAVAQAVADESPVLGYYEEEIDRSRMIFNFQSAPSMTDVVEELEAYLEVFNTYPDIIAIDNLRNFCEEQDYKEQQVVVSDLQTLARTTGATVVLLHHTTEATSRDVRFPQARKDLKNKLGELPEVVITTAVDPDEDVFRLAPVKMRGAKFDATGQTYAELRSDLSRASFAPMPAPAWSPSSEWAVKD